ncbi:hypothetical protein PY365_03650 [Roseiarcaceae bacterium H3SJ34-1]|nr:hypothetical protein [Roseiarcaceae bacterium H3SJ34-1]
MIVARCAPVATGGGVSNDARSALSQFTEVLRLLGIAQYSPGRLTWYVCEKDAERVDMEELRSIKLAGVNAGDTEVQFVRHLSRPNTTVELDAVAHLAMPSLSSNSRRSSEGVTGGAPLPDRADQRKRESLSTLIVGANL